MNLRDDLIKKASYRRPIGRVIRKQKDFTRDTLTVVDRKIIDVVINLALEIANYTGWEGRIHDMTIMDAIENLLQNKLIAKRIFRMADDLDVLLNEGKLPKQNKIIQEIHSNLSDIDSAQSHYFEDSYKISSLLKYYKYEMSPIQKTKFIETVKNFRKIDIVLHHSYRLRIEEGYDKPPTIKRGEDEDLSEENEISPPQPEIQPVELKHNNTPNDPAPPPQPEIQPVELKHNNTPNDPAPPPPQPKVEHIPSPDDLEEDHTPEPYTVEVEIIRPPPIKPVIKTSLEPKAVATKHIDPPESQSEPPAEIHSEIQNNLSVERKIPPQINVHLSKDRAKIYGNLDGYAERLLSLGGRYGKIRKKGEGWVEDRTTIFIKMAKRNHLQEKIESILQSEPEQPTEPQTKIEVKVEILCILLNKLLFLTGESEVNDSMAEYTIDVLFQEGDACDNPQKIPSLRKGVPISDLAAQILEQNMHNFVKTPGRSNRIKTCIRSIFNLYCYYKDYTDETDFKIMNTIASIFDKEIPNEFKVKQKILKCVIAELSDVEITQDMRSYYAFVTGKIIDERKSQKYMVYLSSQPHHNV
jgi:hypothetical protein